MFCNLEDFGGSAKIARELFNMLQPRHDDYVTQEEMTERLDDVLKLYLKQKDEDMSGKVFFFFKFVCFVFFFAIDLQMLVYTIRGR